jgi:dihydrofolate reductase
VTASSDWGRDRSAHNPQKIVLVQVAAIADNGVIGNGGCLPWQLKSDMAHFRRITMGKPVVMGRKTFLAIGKPLQGRTNIVLTRDRHFAVSGVLTAESVANALDAAHGDALRREVSEIAIIGGAEIYAQTIGMADRLAITHVHLQAKGDSRFPVIDQIVWEEVSRRECGAAPGDDASFSLALYERRNSRA